jgi:hypothetical protein
MDNARSPGSHRAVQVVQLYAHTSLASSADPGTTSMCKVAGWESSVLLQSCAANTLTAQSAARTEQRCQQLDFLSRSVSLIVHTVVLLLALLSQNH